MNNDSTVDRNGILIVVSGFSGAGKGTLMKRLVAKYENYALSVSMTTRAPRQGEKDGREYFFVTREAFERTIAEDGLIEYAEYVDNYYGTPKAYVEKELAAGKDVILEIELHGALQIKEKHPDALLLFVLPPSIGELRRRLSKRGSETEESIEKRLRRAKEEVDGIAQYDFIIINDELNESVERLHQAVLVAHAAPKRNRVFIEQLRKELA